MSEYDIFSILQRISHAYPDKPVDEPTLKVYQDELSDIPLPLLERAARQHIHTSIYFPRISELRQIAQQLAGAASFIPDLSPGRADLILEVYRLEQDYFMAAEFDIKKWEKLADQLEASNRPHRAAEVREKARHILESEAAFQRGEEYPSREARQRYAQWDTDS